MSNEDLTGRSQLTRNVSASYAGHLVFIIFGFIMPRAIDEQLGQTALGVWDFSWAFVNYLNLAMLGIGSSVNRYVARYRASGDTDALNRTVSSVMVVQLGIALLVFAASFVLAWVVPVKFADRLGTFAPTAGWVIGLLGGSLAVQMAFDTWRGVLTGCHRWDLYNFLNAGGYAVTAVIMLVVLMMGGNLRDTASVYLVMTALTELLRLVIARRTCPELRIRLAYVNVRDAKKVIRFGVKTFLMAISTIMTVQTVNVMLVAHLGPAALAVLSRPMALAMQVSSLSSKYAYVLTPAAGSLQSQHRTEELKEFALRSARSGWLIAIPPLTFLFVVGDLVVAVWMGPGYSAWITSAVLAAGFLLPVSQGPVLRIMVGLNAHGKIAKTGVVIALVLLGTGILLLDRIGWSVPRAAAMVAVPIGFGIGVNILFYAFRHLQVSLHEYYHTVLRDGLALLAVLGVTLALIRWLSPFSALWTVALCAAATAIILQVMLREDINQIRQALRKRPVDEVP